MNYANQLGAMSVDSDGPFSDAESDPEHDGSSASQQGQIAHKIDQLQSEIVGLRLYTGAWVAQATAPSERRRIGPPTLRLRAGDSAELAEQRPGGVAAAHRARRGGVLGIKGARTAATAISTGVVAVFRAPAKGFRGSEGSRGVIRDPFVTDDLCAALANDV